MSQRKTAHATFSIERYYDSPPARVFAAWATPAAKTRWFGGPAEWAHFEYKLDFRVGGREVNRGGPTEDQVHAYDALYQDIIPNERIIYTYDMHIGKNRISVSLATVEFKATGAGTTLVFTEQGAFLDDYDDAGSREEGTKWLLGKLEDSLRD